MDMPRCCIPTTCTPRPQAKRARSRAAVSAPIADSSRAERSHAPCPRLVTRRGERAQNGPVADSGRSWSPATRRAHVSERATSLAGHDLRSPRASISLAGTRASLANLNDLGQGSVSASIRAPAPQLTRRPRPTNMRCRRDTGRPGTGLHIRIVLGCAGRDFPSPRGVPSIAALDDAGPAEAPAGTFPTRRCSFPEGGRGRPPRKCESRREEGTCSSRRCSFPTGRDTYSSRYWPVLNRADAARLVTPPH
jgi:hypothetical protein